ncbi:MAG: hypothetical protein CMJ64_14190 [Planctomycetaceae bacterium]|nr:hypothetical protein [Planctomycetaceae bacterium]
MSESKPKPAEPEWDPTYLHSLREVYVIIALFAFFCVWSIFVCYNYGYLSPGEQRSTVTTVLGMPSWAFWGLCLPWLAVDIVAIWFCFFFMVPDDLGEDQPDVYEEMAGIDGKETGNE